MRIKALALVLLFLAPTLMHAHDSDSEDDDVELATIGTRDSRRSLTNSGEAFRNSKEEKINAHQIPLWQKIVCCLCIPKSCENACSWIRTLAIIGTIASVGVLSRPLILQLISGVNDLQTGARDLQEGSDLLKAGCNETRVACERLETVSTECISQFEIARALVAACVQNCSQIVKEQMAHFLNDFFSQYDWKALIPTIPNVTLPPSVHTVVNNIPPIPIPPIATPAIPPVPGIPNAPAPSGYTLPPIPPIPIPWP